MRRQADVWVLTRIATSTTLPCHLEHVSVPLAIRPTAMGGIAQPRPPLPLEEIVLTYRAAVSNSVTYDT
jgi:hypothetical protein